MKGWLILGLAGLLGAVGGFGAGQWSGAPTMGRLDAASTLESSIVARSRSGPSRLAFPHLSAADFGDSVMRFLRDMKGAGKAELLAYLEQVSADPTMLPALRGYYRKALLTRLVELGATEEALTAGDARDREEAASIVIEQFAKKDPAAAETLVFTLEAGPMLQTGMQALFKTLGAHPDRGIALLRTRPESREVGYAFFNSWAAREPKVAAETALTLQKELNGSFLHSAIYQWTEDDPEAAWKWIQGLPQETKDQAWNGYANALVNKDPSHALDVFLSRPEFRSTMTMFVNWIGEKLTSDVASADALLARVPPGDIRTRLVGGIASKLFRSNPDEALAWAQTLLPGERDPAIQSAFRSLSFEDPAGAIELAATHLKGAAAESAIASVAGEWMSSNFEDAFSALTKHLDNAALKRVLPTALSPTYSLIGKDPTSRFELLAKLDPEVRGEAFRTMGTQWGMMNPSVIPAMKEQLAALRAEDRTAFVQGLLRGAQSTSASQTAELVQWLPPEEQLANASSIANGLSNSDPQAAAIFLRSLPGTDNAPARTEATQGLLREWAYENPAAAIGFVAALPAGAGKDGAATELARQLGRFDPENATRQLTEISDPEARATLIRELSGLWKRVDANRGRALLLSQANSEAEKRSITTAMKAR